jgi:endonuclease YncB( thermonuclease family)
MSKISKPRDIFCDPNLPRRDRPCGSVAANSLADYIGGRAVTCSPRATDRYWRVVAVCSVSDVDLGRRLVGGGHALDWPLYSRGVYSADQATAKRAFARVKVAVDQVVAQ